MTYEINSFTLSNFFTILILVGCNAITFNDDQIAHISVASDSEYEKTFKDLGLGVVFDFDLKLKSLEDDVTIWTEVYQDGQKVEFGGDLTVYNLTEKVQRIGAAIYDEEILIIALDEGRRATVRPSTEVENPILLNSGATSWEYAIDENYLKQGEEKIIAVYRQDENTMTSGYNFQDENVVNNMINEHAVVVLLKVKVE